MHVAGNQLRRLRKDGVGPCRLQTLKISGNKLKHLPEWLGDLKFLAANGNQLSALPRGGWGRKLCHLALQANSLQQLNVSRMECLEKLLVSDNFPLRRLDLGAAPLKTLQAYGYLPFENLIELRNASV